jgi:thioredoxin-related protein
MKRWISAILLLCSLQLWAANVEWLTNVQAAQEKASRENKLLLLDFTGSDWCGWCMKLKAEVFDQPEFATFAESRLVSVEIDFPRHKSIPQAQAQINEQLASALHITGFPTIIILNSAGRPLGKLGYTPGGPKAFIAQIERLAASQAGEKQPLPATESTEPARKPPTFTPIAPTAPTHYGKLALKSISGPKDRRMVLINNATLLVGETAKVRVEDHFVMVACTEIRDDSVLITCDGRPMELKFAKP